MKRISARVDIRLAPERLFAWLSDRWEEGNPLGGEARAAAFGPTARMGEGFRVPCPAGQWALPAAVELVVHAYRPVEGWCAEAAEIPLLWETRISPLAPGAARLTCRLWYDASAAGGRLRELLGGRGRRRRALRHLLRTWRGDAERREALRRLEEGAGIGGLRALRIERPCPAAPGEPSPPSVARTLDELTGTSQPSDHHSDSS